MTAPILRVENLSKSYKLGELNRRTFFRDLRARLGGAQDAGSVFWALRDISFEIGRGEVLGILGHNGAGKSTLLKILSQITAPSAGRVKLRGRVASLLEVGTGFHQELTGRDNVFLNGSILGMTRREVAAKFDEIAAFSGVEEFLDTPVKRYSSGMRVRLAFAVAAHLEPEILIIDEVLAVGDASFQQKCLGKIGEVAKAGRTVIFVSHNTAAVENLCRRGIVLSHGRVAFDGTQTEAIGYYLNSIGGGGRSLRERTDRSGSGEIRVVGIEFRDTSGKPVGAAMSGRDLDVWLHFENHTSRTPPELAARINVMTPYGVPVFSHSNRFTNASFGKLPSAGAFVCRIPRLPLPAANYQIEVRIAPDLRSPDPYDLVVNAAELSVAGGDFFGSGFVPTIRGGVALVEAAWRLESDSSPADAAGNL